MATDSNLRPSSRRLENVEDRSTEVPRVDVYENEKELLVVCDLPGVSRDTLEIRAEQDELVLEGRRTAALQATPLAAEFGTSDFRREFRLPRGIDREHIEAKLDAGVLWLHLPKAASLRPRRIEVKGG